MTNLDKEVAQAMKDNPELAKPMIPEPVVEAKPEVAHPQGATQPEPQPEPAQPERHKPDPEESWKILREDRDRLRREREQMASELQEIRQYLYKQQQDAKQVGVREEDLEVALPGEYDTVEAKHLAEIYQKTKLRDKRQEERVKKMEQDMNNMIVENRLLIEEPDYRNIMTAENIKKLEELEPEIAVSIASNPDPYKMRKAAIKAIKTYVMPEEKTRSKELEMKAQSEKISQNLSKPLPSVGGINNPSTTPLSKANAFSGGLLTTERKKEIWKEWVESQGGKYYDFKH